MGLKGIIDEGLQDMNRTPWLSAPSDSAKPVLHRVQRQGVPKSWPEFSICGKDCKLTGPFSSNLVGNHCSQAPRVHALPACCSAVCANRGNHPNNHFFHKLLDSAMRHFSSLTPF